jgi:peptidoglycan/xylan/chitin deacetylase (PgdA/CDA1 family)
MIDREFSNLSVLPVAPSVAKFRGHVAYHEIHPTRADSWYTVTLTSFRQQMRMVAQVGGIHVTFDDGTYPAYHYAAEILADFGIRATFFVCAGLIGSPKFMEWDHVRQLADEGHDIQCHGWRHRLLTHCNTRELQEELIGSRLTIENKIGREITAISMPGGRVNSYVLAQCAQAGYTTVYSSDPWVDRQDKSGVHVQGRMMIDRNTTPQTLRWLSQGSRRIHWPLRVKGLLRSGAKVCIGDQFYQQLWRKLSGRSGFATSGAES